MIVLGLQGSPRKKGNTEHLLSIVMREAESIGAKTITVNVAEKKIHPCLGCGYCEKNGYCVIQNDDMASEIYPLLRAADIIVTATPMYFYSATAQLKALIDRSQAFWSRKYRFKLSDPRARQRKGFLIAIGATKGKNLFDGIFLTAKYFFDAIHAEFAEKLTYRKIEHPSDIENHPTALKDVGKSVHTLVTPLVQRKKVLFSGDENACGSQMAAAFTQYNFGNNIEASSCGISPADVLNPLMREVMAEKGLDMAYRPLTHIDDAINENSPDVIVDVSRNDSHSSFKGYERIKWDLPAPDGTSIETMRNLRDDINERVINLFR